VWHSLHQRHGLWQSQNKKRLEAFELQTWQKMLKISWENKAIKNRAVYYKSAVSQQHWTCHRQSTPTWKTKVNGDGWTVTGHYKPTLQQTTKEQDEFRPNWIFTTVLVHYNMMVSQTAQFSHQRSCADCQQ